MMLNFIEDPQANASWLEFGGFETLRSYGLSLPPAELKSYSKRRIQQMIAAYIPDDHLKFIKSLGYGFHTQSATEQWVLAHAGFNPAKSLLNQPINDLIWGSNFTEHKEEAAQRLIFGHNIKKSIKTDEKWIGIDTGAYKTGQLSAARVTYDGRIEIISYRLDL